MTVHTCRFKKPTKLYNCMKIINRIYETSTISTTLQQETSVFDKDENCLMCYL